MRGGKLQGVQFDLRLGLVWRKARGINWQGNWGHVIKGPESQIVNFLLQIKGSHWRFWAESAVIWAVLQKIQPEPLCKMRGNRQEEKLGADHGNRWEWGSVTVMRELLRKGGRFTGPGSLLELRGVVLTFGLW